MIPTYNIETNESIEFDDFIQGIDPNFYETPDNTALMMAKLYNNRNFLAEYLNDNLKKGFKSREDSLYSPNVFSIHREKYFFVRAVVWKPVGNKALYFYDFPHDHNFHFMTLGYSGPGYKTLLTSYDRSKYIGFDGEKVELAPTYEVQLKPGCIMHYRRNVEIHSQLPPDEISVSINVIETKLLRSENQFQFDLKQGTLKDITTTRPQQLLVEMLGILGDRNSVDIFISISRVSPCEKTRVAAFKALEKLGESRWNEALSDKHPLVSRSASLVLEGHAI